MTRRAWTLALALGLACPCLAHGQLPAVSVPKGLLRVEVNGVFGAFDEQFNDGARESYAAGQASPALGADRIPALAALDADIADITGTAGPHLNLGRLTAAAHADISSAVLGLGYGLSDRLTVFGRIPLTSLRVQSYRQLDPSSANAGLTPPQGQFFTDFQTALDTLQYRINSGAYTTPDQQTLAQATLTRGTAIRDDLLALLGNASTTTPFAPTASSADGIAITAVMTNLRTTLHSLGVNEFTHDSTPTLPTDPLSAADFESFVSALGYRDGQTQLRYRGDAELGAAFTLVDRWDRDGGAGGFRMAASALVRLPTGIRSRSDRLLDLGTGDGQTDVELGVVTDVGGGRWGVRATGTYVRQLPADIQERVTSPGQPFVGPERLAIVRWNPGDVLAIDVRPFYRLAPTLAIQVGAQHWRHGADDVTYASATDAIPGVDASVLAIGTKASATSVSAGVTYANLGALGPSGHGLPVEASWTLERVVSSGEGLVPASQQMRATLRLYFEPFK